MMTDVQSFYGVGNREESKKRRKDRMTEEECRLPGAASGCGEWCKEYCMNYGIPGSCRLDQKTGKMMVKVDEGKKTDLDPCPFCLEHRLTFRTSKYGTKYVYCTWCGARGPEKSNETRAAEAWNKRGMQR